MKKEAVSVLKPRKGKKIDNKVNKVSPKKEIRTEKKIIEQSLSSTTPRGPKPKVLSIQNINVGNIAGSFSKKQSKSDNESNKSKKITKVPKSSKVENAATVQDKMAETPILEDCENSVTRGPKNKRPKPAVVPEEAGVVTKKAKVQSKIEPAVVATVEKPKSSKEKTVSRTTEKKATRSNAEIPKEAIKIAPKSEKINLPLKRNSAENTTIAKSKIAKGKKDGPATIEKVKVEKVKLAVSKNKLKVTPKIEKKSTEADSTITDKSQNVKTIKSYPKELENSGDLKLTKQHILSSIKAIKKLTQKILKAKTSLLPEENHPILLQITPIKVPKTPRRQIRPILPHSMVSPMDDVAIFVADLIPGRKRDYEKTVEHWEEKFREKGVECIKQIIPMNQVKTEYGQFEMKKKLAMSFDHFLADGRICGHLFHLLGRSFFKRRSPPTPVHMRRDDLKNEINTALQKTCLIVHSLGDSHNVQVGTVSMKSPKLADNIWALCSSLAAEYPGGWANIRAIHIKSRISPSIPIYMNLVSKNKVRVPVVKPKRPRAYETVEGELTTVGGGPATVTVTPEGRVTVKREKKEIKKEETDDEKKIKIEKPENTEDEDEDEDDAGAESEDEGDGDQ